MFMLSSPPTMMAGRSHSTQRGSSSAGCGSIGMWEMGSNTVMIWPSTSTARGTSTVSLCTRIRRSAMLDLPVPGGPYRNMAPSEISAGPSSSRRPSLTTRSENASRIDLAVDLGEGRLLADDVDVLVERDRERSGVAAQPHALVGVLAAQVGERELVVATFEPEDLDVAEIAQLLDDLGHRVEADAQALGQADRRGLALEQGAAQGQVLDHRHRQVQLGARLRRLTSCSSPTVPSLAQPYRPVPAVAAQVTTSPIGLYGLTLEASAKSALPRLIVAVVAVWRLAEPDRAGRAVR